MGLSRLLVATPYNGSITVRTPAPRDHSPHSFDLPPAPSARNLHPFHLRLGPQEPSQSFQGVAAWGGARLGGADCTLTCFARTQPESGAGRWLGLTPEQPALCLRGFLRRPRAAPSRGRSRGTRLLRDQLGRADAGSWQIADRYYTASSAARVVAVGDFRARFVVEL
eukprot:scaffold88713_cov24-Phaeocystis_antarctica.AAC.1